MRCASMTLAVVLIFSCRPELEADEFSALEDGCVVAAAVDMDEDEECASEVRGFGNRVVVWEEEERFGAICGGEGPPGQG